MFLREYTIVTTVEISEKGLKGEEIPELMELDQKIVVVEMFQTGVPKISSQFPLLIPASC